MQKTPLTFITTGIIALFLLTACTEDSEETTTAVQTGETSAETKKTAAPVKKNKATAKRQRTQRPNNKNSLDPAIQKLPIMNQPVDFSTPESVEKTLMTISEAAGPQVGKKIESKMGYMMVYDLSVGHDKEKLYKKLNGKTPNEIIAMKKR